MKLSLKEWPLVAFTILVQAVAGAFVLLFSLVVINAHHFFPSGAARLFPLFFRPAFGLLFLMGLSLIISLFHLGQPSAAYLAVRNVGTSWLSREILGSCLFFAGLIVLSAFIYFDMSVSLILIIASLEALLGLSLPYIMSKIYRLPAVPAWNNWRTTFSFYLSWLVIGAGYLPLAVRHFFSAGPGSTLAGQTVSFLQIILLISIVYLLLFDQVAGFFPLKNMISAENISGLKKFSKSRRWLLLLALLLSFCLSWSGVSLCLSGFLWPGLILALVVIEEVIGRTIFFGLYERLGV